MKVKKFDFQTEKEEEKALTEGIRINKFLADAGVCSRREGDKAVEEGRVTIDGKPAVMGSKVLPGQSVTYNGKPVKRDEDMILIAYNKPEGITCTTSRKDPDNIIDAIDYGKRIYPIGRLDKNSEGLILLTNNGDIVNKILRAGNRHEKEYQVVVNREVTDEFIRNMSVGVAILDTVTKPCEVIKTGRNSFTIILTQGLNRQIRRMCEALGYRVLHLKRVRIMNIKLGRLKTGDYRNLADWELSELKETLKHSSGLPASETEDYDE